MPDSPQPDSAQQDADQHDAAAAPPERGPVRPTEDDLLVFFGEIPQRVADAGLRQDEVPQVAEVLEQFASSLKRSGYEPAASQGPDPDHFPGDSARIAAAALDVDRRLRGLDPEGWNVMIGERDVLGESLAVHECLVDDYDLTAWSTDSGG